MRILLTGAHGFLGWHTRVRASAVTEHDVIALGRENWTELPGLAANADAVIHAAGVNRGDPDDIESVNRRLAEDVATALKNNPCIRRVVNTNSIQAGSDTPYGRGKAAAAETIAAAANESGAQFVDVRLPNLFGEGGRPHYNSFVATFINKLINDERPEISDRPIELLHVQAAARNLLTALTTDVAVAQPTAVATNVLHVYNTLAAMKNLYLSGDIPPLVNDLDLPLFNSLRFAMFPEHYPIDLVKHSDHRGDLVEAVKAHGGQGQTFVSTTHPGVTRGEHFHLEKVERFVVIRGTARIALRRLFDNKVIAFEVDGERPMIIDMPTMWAHNITNTGDTDLVTLFWAHELFDPAAPDTFPEPVGEPL